LVRKSSWPAGRPNLAQAERWARLASAARAARIVNSCYVVDMPKKAAPNPADTQPVGRVIRVNVSPAAWRALRIQAAEHEQPMTDYLGGILMREAEEGSR
jgi:hypothetical protein